MSIQTTCFLVVLLGVSCSLGLQNTDPPWFGAVNSTLWKVITMINEHTEKVVSDMKKEQNAKWFRLIRGLSKIEKENAEGFSETNKSLSKIRESYVAVVNKRETVDASADLPHRGVGATWFGAVNSTLWEVITMINEHTDKVVSDMKNEQNAKLSKLITGLSKIEKENAEGFSETNKSLSKIRESHPAVLTKYSAKSFAEVLERQREALLGEKNHAVGVCHKGMKSSSQYVRLNPVPGGVVKTSVLCDTKTDGGGWIVIMRRTKMGISFFRWWRDYKYGFGDEDTFWWGNNNIHAITNSGRYELRIEMKNPTEPLATATYSNFSIGSEKEQYKLHVSGFKGGINNQLELHDGVKFSTRDRDNDRYRWSCTFKYGGAWWYDDCCSVCLTKWPKRNTQFWKGVKSTVANFVEMKIRLRSD